jgi:hypothetical protein
VLSIRLASLFANKALLASACIYLTDGYSCDDTAKISLKFDLKADLELSLLFSFSIPKRYQAMVQRSDYRDQSWKPRTKQKDWISYFL